MSKIANSQGCENTIFEGDFGKSLPASAQGWNVVSE